MSKFVLAFVKFSLIGRKIEDLYINIVSAETSGRYLILPDMNEEMKQLEEEAEYFDTKFKNFRKAMKLKLGIDTDIFYMYEWF